MRDSRLRIALQLFEPGQWSTSADLAGRSVLYTSPHSLGNAFGSLCKLGLLEVRKQPSRGARNAYRLTEAGIRELDNEVRP